MGEVNCIPTAIAALVSFIAVTTPTLFSVNATAISSILGLNLSFLGRMNGASTMPAISAHASAYKHAWQLNILHQY